MAVATQQQQVTFGDLTIREYPIIMGDNPAANGCPITIGWKKMSESTRNLELYEYTRQDRRYGKKKLAIPVQARSQMLLDAGYTQDQIIDRALEVAEIKRQRQESAKDNEDNIQNFGKKLSSNIMTGINKLSLGAIPVPPSQRKATSVKRNTISARTA